MVFTPVCINVYSDPMASARQLFFLAAIDLLRMIRLQPWGSKAVQIQAKLAGKTVFSTRKQRKVLHPMQVFSTDAHMQICFACKTGCQGAPRRTASGNWLVMHRTLILVSTFNVTTVLRLIHSNSFAFPGAWKSAAMGGAVDGGTPG